MLNEEGMRTRMSFGSVMEAVVPSETVSGTIRTGGCRGDEGLIGVGGERGGGGGKNLDGLVVESGGKAVVLGFELQVGRCRRGGEREELEPAHRELVAGSEIGVDVENHGAAGVFERLHLRQG
jgi:hypothetical protein